MIHGTLKEEVTRLLGPLRCREVYEEWRDGQQNVVARSPRLRHLTLVGDLGVRTLSRLPAAGGHVERLEV